MHWFVVAKAHPTNLNTLERVAYSKVGHSYPPNHLNMNSQFNWKSVRFYKFEFEPSQENYFLECLAPFNCLDNGLKSKLKYFFVLFRKTFNLKNGKQLNNKRKFENPEWRDWINVLVIGYKLIKKEGKEFMQYFVVMDSQRKYQEEFVKWMESREARTMLPNHPGLVYKPGWRLNEIRLYNVTCFKSTEGQLLSDLAPFGWIEENQSWFIKKLFKFGRKLFGLLDPPSPIHKPFIYPQPEWKHQTDVYMVAKKKDKEYYDKEYVPLGEMI